MHVDTITMDPRIARIHYADYRKKVRETRERRQEELAAKAKETGKELKRLRIQKTLLEKEDEHLLGAYRALCRGERILNINQVLAAAGLQEHTRLPKFAVCRANAKWCRISTHSYPSRLGVIFTASDTDNVPWKTKRNDFVEYPTNVPYITDMTNAQWRMDNKFPRLPAMALVPTVPVQLRPANLEDYHILWEAEWQKTPPVDPILLKRTGPDSPIFTVVAQWDLTPLERGILDGRFSGQ